MTRQCEWVEAPTCVTDGRFVLRAPGLACCVIGTWRHACRRDRRPCVLVAVEDGIGRGRAVDPDSTCTCSAVLRDLFQRSEVTVLRLTHDSAETSRILDRLDDVAHESHRDDLLPELRVDLSIAISVVSTRKVGALRPFGTNSRADFTASQVLWLLRPKVGSDGSAFSRPGAFHIERSDGHGGSRCATDLTCLGLCSSSAR